MAASGNVDFDAIVVGAGFAGIYAVHRLRDQKGLRVRGFERGGDVGGVWYWNRYPGARCDVESLQYCYSFSPELECEWDWSERYSRQPEILDYLRHVADRYDVRKEFQFNTAVTSMVWNEDQAFWIVGTSDGRSYTARFVLACTGALSIGKELEFHGSDKFHGEIYSTHSWPHHEVDFAGKRVGVVGTGSSGVQTICEVAKVASHLTVFQRTPAYAIPLGDTRLDPADVEAWRRNVKERRYHAREETFGGLITYPAP
jgi:cyclohexanone monooxygenase